MKSKQKVYLCLLFICAITLSLYIYFNNNKKEDKKEEVKIESEIKYYKRTEDGYRISENISSKIENSQVRFLMSALTKYNFYIDDEKDNYEGIYLYKNKELNDDFKLYIALNTLYESELFTSTTKEEYDTYKSLLKVSKDKVEQALDILFGSSDIDYNTGNTLSSLKVKYDEENSCYYLISNDEDLSLNYIITETLDVEEDDDVIKVTEVVAFIDTNDKKVYNDYLNQNEVLSLDKSFTFNDDNSGYFNKYTYVFKKDSNDKYYFEGIE